MFYFIIHGISVTTKLMLFHQNLCTPRPQAQKNVVQCKKIHLEALRSFTIKEEEFVFI